MTPPVLHAFLTPENQTLLWSIISENELFQQVLTEPEKWFQSILEMFFTQNNTENTTGLSLYEQLKTLNKRTLLYMVQDLQKRGASFPRNQMFVKPTTVSGIVEQETKMIFASAEKDEPIKNFDELILEQQALREKEIYIPPVASQKTTNEKNA